MPLPLSQAVGEKLMLSFVGATASPEILSTLKQQHIAGLTLFRALNVEDPAQVRELNDALQRAARDAGQPPLLMAVDQEGGTLFAISGTTPFPGNLALGATGSAELSERTGYSIGRELAAMGINVNYAPVCDVNVNPNNPVVGPRAFGEDPAQVARLAAAMVRGLQAAGVAATAKHFPGHGDTATDSHDRVPILLHDKPRLHQVELPPFAAAIQAGAKLVLTGHVALPNFDEWEDLPATLSRAIVHDLLRRELGFKGVITTDAMDMKAIRQGQGLVIDAIAAARAGVDLLLLSANAHDQKAVYDGLLQAVQRGLIDHAEIQASAGRVLALKAWCAQVAPARPPSLDIVNGSEHRALADEIAARSITLVRDDARQLPLQLSADARVAVVVPVPRDLTPADTSSYEKPALADSLRAYFAQVDEFSVMIEPSESDVAALRHSLADYDTVLVGTINATAHPGQVALVNTLLQDHIKTIVVALRMPYDLQAFPQAPSFLCTYSLLPPSMRALARVLVGEKASQGKLPVSIPGLYPIGHGM